MSIKKKCPKCKGDRFSEMSKAVVECGRCDGKGFVFDHTPYAMRDRVLSIKGLGQYKPKQNPSKSYAPIKSDDGISVVDVAIGGFLF